MRHLSAFITAMLAAATLSAAAADYFPGQVWSVKGREKDPDPQVLIIAVEPGTPVGDVVFVAAGGVKLCLPDGKCGDMFSPLAITRDALDRSVKDMIGYAPAPSSEKDRERLQFERGYEMWKQGIEKGARVTITVPLSQALDEMEGGAKIQVK